MAPQVAGKCSRKGDGALSRSWESAAAPPQVAGSKCSRKRDGALRNLEAGKRSSAESLCPAAILRQSNKFIICCGEQGKKEERETHNVYAREKSLRLFHETDVPSEFPRTTGGAFTIP